MLITHLRRNAVAYLALVLALSTGTAYAAGLANGSVTTKKLADNAVTAPKIKKNAVQSEDIKDKSIKAGDLAAGVVPGASWVGGVTKDGTNGAPGPSPDSSLLSAHQFSLPRAGTLQVTAFFPEASGGCDVGAFFLGLYLDGVGIPGTERPLYGTPQAINLVGVVPASTGAHTVTVGGNCPDGSSTGYNLVSTNYTLVLGK
jgi:hypothetical protein